MTNPNNVISFVKYLQSQLDNVKCEVQENKDCNKITNHLDINVPKHIECLWLFFRPNKLPRSISIIIVACLYYPGHTSLYAPSQEDIIFHIADTVHHLSNKSFKPLFMIMGEFNDLRIDDICVTYKSN